MQVERVSDSFPPLSNVKTNDFIIAINCVSVLSCDESFSHHEWNNVFSQFSYPMLICLFRCDSKGTGLLTPSQVVAKSFRLLNRFLIIHVYFTLGMFMELKPFKMQSSSKRTLVSLLKKV